MKFMTFKNAENGIIMDHAGAIFVFTSPEQMTEWFNKNYPLPDTTERNHTVVIGTVDRNHLIGAIKVVREHTGLGLKDAKDLVEEVRDTTANHPITVHDKSEGVPFKYTKADALLFVDALRTVGAVANIQRD